MSHSPDHQGTAERFSLVIPARNEEKYLPAVLESVRTALQNYRGDRSSIRVIVADNVSTDRTASIAREFGAEVVSVEKRVIGAVRNGGAAAARGQYVCFADADNPLHPETFNELDRLLADTRVACGGLGGWPERWTPAMAVFMGMMYPVLVWAMGINGGLVFCRREDFIAIGGYDESMLFAEDVKFVRAIKKHVRARRQRFSATSKAPVRISVRKISQFGEWYLLKSMFKAGWWSMVDRARIDRWAREFWYEDQR